MRTSSAPPVDTATPDGISRLDAGIAAFDAQGRLLLLRRAATAPLPGLWELPSGRIEHGETAQQTAKRELAEQTGLHDVQLTGYAGHIDYTSDSSGTTRQLVYTTTTDLPGVVRSAEHDAHTWRYADALPAVSPGLLALIRRIAPPKPLLPPEEWESSLPRWHVGANALVRDQDGRILIVRPGRSVTFQLPGGQVDAHETPQEAAGRELWEEAGLNLPVGPLIAISFEHPSPGWDHPTQIMLFDLGVVDSAAANITAFDSDIAEHRWVTVQEAESLLGTARTERLHAGLRGLRQGNTVLVTTTSPEI